jgi:small subunit ribosomal protein S13
VKSANIDPQKKAGDLLDAEINDIRSEIDRNYKVEGDLRRDVQQDIQRLTSIGCYRGNRHRLGLPVRGQRTSTNSRTRRGRGKTISVGRKAKEGARKGH